jgi:hypothetical protein
VSTTYHRNEQSQLLIITCIFIVMCQEIWHILKNAVVWDVTPCDSCKEMSVLRRVTRRHIPEDGILYSHRRENLKSYIALTDWTL